ncbi:hypothetical protein Hanom_Chr02g00170201 [Helianthus anomalus]
MATRSTSWRWIGWWWCRSMGLWWFILTRLWSLGDWFSRLPVVFWFCLKTLELAICVVYP